MRENQIASLFATEALEPNFSIDVIGNFAEAVLEPLQVVVHVGIVKTVVSFL